MSVMPPPPSFNHDPEPLTAKEVPQAPASAAVTLVSDAGALDDQYIPVKRATLEMLYEALQHSQRERDQLRASLRRAVDPVYRDEPPMFLRRNRA